MNLLYFVAKAVYDMKMSRVRFEEVEALPKANPPMTVHLTGPGWPDWPQHWSAIDYVNWAIQEAQGDKEALPHAILSYGVNGLQRSPVPVITIFHETYNFPKTMQTIRDIGAKLVIFTYANDLPLYAPLLEAEDRILYSIPHSATSEIYQDWVALAGQQKDIDVLIVGNLAEQFYPFRYRLARLAKRELSKRGYRIGELPHPGFTLPVRDGTVIGREYAAWLSRAKLVLTCCSKQKYAFCKLVEIPLSGSLPVSDLPAERQGFFRQTCLNVEPWMLDREILTKIEDVLDDEELRRHLTIRAMEKVQERLEMRHWAERFIYATRRFLLGEDPAPPTPPMGDADK